METAPRRVLKQVMAAEGKTDGLAPIMISPISGQLSGVISLGARGDSYYEYLLKQWLLEGKADESMIR